MDLVKRVKELEDRLIEVMSAGVIKLRHIKELEEALCQANGKLEELRDNPNASTEKDEEIINAFIDMIKRKGWKPMEAKDNMCWFGGKTHYRLADYLPKEAIDSHSLEDIDFLVVGWTNALKEEK